MIRVGLISDTHGLLRPEAFAALQGSQMIVHAGDIGDAEVLASLRRIAPVTAVRGNNDFGAWAEGIPEQAELAVGEVRVLVLHDLAALKPGSAGPRRFRLPISLARLRISGSAIEHELISL